MFQYFTLHQRVRRLEQYMADLTKFQSDFTAFQADFTGFVTNVKAVLATLAVGATEQATIDALDTQLEAMDATVKGITFPVA